MGASMQLGVTPVERFAFSEQANGAHAFVQTGGTVPYACYLLKKGVV
jgi:L-fucose mutarotase/ribose pyranase (RbsD/FucU family)